ncbi:MAG TPA: DUF2309 domain-containing protein [Bacteroidetes bacterium]|nr:DUF2309 domain-containing protein [Bacteroidota bacterium]
MVFSEHEVLHQLKHYLPAQAPLKDFIHHNTLHAFQHLPFHEALQQASELFGYQVYLSLPDYRERYTQGKIRPEMIARLIREKKGQVLLEEWTLKLLKKEYDTTLSSRIGALRASWKELAHVNLNKDVHPVLFRVSSAYLDQGIALWKFPRLESGFLASLVRLESKAVRGVFRSSRVKKLLADPDTNLTQLLKIIVGDPQYYKNYLFDMCFSHPGWSGMISILEDQPDSLLDKRNIQFREFLIFELLLEIDSLDRHLGDDWKPLSESLSEVPPPLLGPIEYAEVFEVYALWQEALEWTYYDEVLAGFQKAISWHKQKGEKFERADFQALFCIDDRSCSTRRNLEALAPGCQTFGTAGHFNVAIYFQPEHGKFSTKVCPAPVTPKYLIKETEAGIRHKKDAHFHRHSHGLVGGWIVSQTLGFWSAIKMAVGIFRPSESPAMVSSFKHMDRSGKLSVRHVAGEMNEKGLQVGFTPEEMADQMEGLLKSIGLIANFAPLVYIVGHGASSINNTHYAGYDCGACSGRAGSVNSRVAAYMLNQKDVREILGTRGINIPEDTQFLGALHDTTRDEIEFYDVESLSGSNSSLYVENMLIWEETLDKNAKERSRRFLLHDSKDEAARVHEEVKLRALSLFEPRPEWNHATNTLCLIGRREVNKHLFLDRRAFLNSYDYRLDPDGHWLLGILKAVAPVCGGINLEYYFSRVDNYRLGAGSKLPHNVVGLIGVANGMDGDLRPGLPMQMINIHEPLRLLVIVEQQPEVVLKTLKADTTTYEWFKNGWVNLVVTDPETDRMYRFMDGEFEPYSVQSDEPGVLDKLDDLIETESESLPVYLINV